MSELRQEFGTQNYALDEVRVAFALWIEIHVLTSTW